MTVVKVPVACPWQGVENPIPKYDDEDISMNSTFKIAASKAIAAVLIAFLSIPFLCYGKKHKNEPAQAQNDVAQTPREIPMPTPKGNIALIFSGLSSEGPAGGPLQPVKFERISSQRHAVHIFIPGSRILWI
jgi:hypothetical protein